MMDMVLNEENGLMTNDLVFAKLRPDAIIPTKRDEDAGYDIYANFEEDCIAIYPHSTALVPTGIASALCDKYYLQVHERGSTGSIGLKYSAGVIDSGFRGEIKILLCNTNDIPIYISKFADSVNKFQYGIFYPYKKAIAQLIVHGVPKMNVREMSYEDLLKIPSGRGTGELGSSGK
jgi:dUTP pyrophosphatase